MIRTSAFQAPRSFRPSIRVISRNFSTRDQSHQVHHSNHAAHPHDDQVRIQDHGHSKLVVLNVPKTKNALNLNMVRSLTSQYKQWEHQPNTVVVMKGNGDAFCSGGDIKAIYTEVVDQKKFNLSHAFFNEEYNLNNLIGRQKVTQVSLLNGITFGGGVGLSVHGKFRVAHEDTFFAMPETGIGFFCDVGGGWFLPRLRLGPHFGMFLALTGYRLKGRELLYAGVATHLVEATKFHELEERLLRTKSEEVRNVLEEYSKTSDSHGCEIVELRPYIDKCFNQQSVEDIIKALDKMSKDDSAPAHAKKWATNTLGYLHKVSPTSLKVVFEQLRRGAKLNSLEEVLKMEFNISQNYMKPTSDFFEGVRALLVDKDKNPKWKPAHVHDVTPQIVDSFFTPAKTQWHPF
eukprot:CAMPEP_0168559662 /NCGR_PEP_ID=MMETSP0413-20121227/10644_1 /TAXON_ID=136452 /ORGANISM="Filamoeba nolandi, Strain NC-AS-23-1" /LENGTH=402 /DNA_ID=CAMNT_0008590907 /DNA_START=19 /DNA_END=1227 /DNA_ORIENTATION=-